VRTRLKRRNTGRVFSKLWLPAVVLVVIAIVSYGVNAVRHMSDAITNPPAKSSIPATVVQINPKNVTYEVFGTLTRISIASQSKSRWRRCPGLIPKRRWRPRPL
jgi:Mycobacterium membrane protein